MKGELTKSVLLSVRPQWCAKIANREKTLEGRKNRPRSRRRREGRDMTETERAIEHFEYGISHDIFSEPVTTYARLAVAALRAQLARETIVRCGECKHSQQGTIYPTCLYCYNPKFNGNGFRVEADGFCSAADMREATE